MSELIPTKQVYEPAHSPAKELILAQGQVNLERIRNIPDGEEPFKDFLRAVQADLQPRAKLRYMWDAADRINEIVTPHSACRNGCSHCCHIAVIISHTEADAISRHTGIKAKKVKGRPEENSTSIQKYFGKACPFLKKGKCSIYEVRPFACRMMFNLSETPSLCDTAVKPEDSAVAIMDLSQLEQARVFAFYNDSWGDIREFFPGK